MADEIENKLALDAATGGDAPTLFGETGNAGGEKNLALDGGAAGDAAGAGDGGKPPGRVRRALSKLLGGGEALACSCGRKPGVQGRHAKSCPLSISSGAKHGAAPVLPDEGGGAQDGPARVRDVPGERPVAPKDYSFYGEAVKKFLRTRSRLKVLRKEEELDPLIGEAEARELAAQYALESDEIADLERRATQAAQHHDAPEISPALGLLFFYAEIEIRWKINDMMNARRIRRIVAAQEVAQQAAQAANQPGRNED